MKVVVAILATQKYVAFLPALTASLRKRFLTSHQVDIAIMTDAPDVPEGCIRLEGIHGKWPFPTLHRYRQIMANESFFHFPWHTCRQIAANGTIAALLTAEGQAPS